MTAVVASQAPMATRAASRLRPRRSSSSAAPRASAPTRQARPARRAAGESLLAQSDNMAIAALAITAAPA
jgi:hypothetical protein